MAVARRDQSDVTSQFVTFQSEAVGFRGREEKDLAGWKTTKLSTQIHLHWGAATPHETSTNQTAPEHTTHISAGTPNVKNPTLDQIFQLPRFAAADEEMCCFPQSSYTFEVSGRYKH